MTFLKKHWRTAAVILACAAMLTVITRSALAGPATQPRDADVAEADAILSPGALRAQRPEGEWVGGLGVVEPARPESELSFAVAGRVAAVHVDEGQRVEAGEALVELESGVERAQLAAAEAEVAQAEAELLRARRGLRPEERSALEAESEAARARAELAQGVLERLEAASAGGGVSRDELARAQREAEAADRTATAATSRLRAGSRGRVEDVRIAQARLAAAEARREQARATLERLQIVAPAAGEVLEVLYRVGEYVQPGGVEPVVVVGETSSLRARIDVDERDVARVREGARALVTVDALPDRRFEGRVVEVARRMGRKNVRTDEPTERIDTKILEVVVDLGPIDALIVGQRVMGYVSPTEAASRVSQPTARGE